MEHKRYHIAQRMMACILILAVFFSAGFGTAQTAAAGKIRLNRTKVSLKAGKTFTLKVYGTKKKARWVSKKKSVATVSAAGKVRAKRAGTAKIVAKVSGRKYTCKVIVSGKKKLRPQPAKRPESTVKTDTIPIPTPVPLSTAKPTDAPEPALKIYTFRSDKLLEEHYQKHGVEMGFLTKEDYAAAANAVIHSPDALHKLEAEDGDDVYYLEATNEFVIVSTSGYIRTYFYPSDGKDYFDRQ